MKKAKQFIINGLLLTAVSLVMRSVSVSFQVYLSNKIGATAMGLFTLISTVYGFAITVATSGIQFATTRMVAEAMGQDHGQESSNGIGSATVRCILRKCILYALCFSLGSGLVLYIFAPTIGVYLLSDIRTVLPLKILAFTLPPIALSAVMNGYFTAVRRVYKNATVQVLGEAIRIFMCVLLLSMLLPGDVEYAALAVILGGAIAEIASFAIHGLFFLFERSHEKKERLSSCEGERVRKKLLHIALPMAFSAYVRSALVTIEHLLIPWGLERSGSSRDTALASYGRVHSMVFPLILFPSALSSSFAGLLIPEVAEARAAGDNATIERTINRVLEAVLTYAIGVAGIVMCFSYELGDTVYPGNGTGRYILMLAPLIPVMYMDTSVDAILKGLGQQVYHMSVNIADATLSIILVVLLLPRFGILGYVLTVYFTEIINFAFSLGRLLVVSKVKPRVGRWVVAPIVCVVLATSAVRYCLEQISVFETGAPRTAAHIFCAGVLYIALIALSKLKRKKAK